MPYIECRMYTSRAYLCTGYVQNVYSNCIYRAGLVDVVYTALPLIFTCFFLLQLPVTTHPRKGIHMYAHLV